MNTVALLCVLVAAAPPQVPLADADTPVFSRPEPHLQAGAAQLRQGDAVAALESFRKATGKNANERAIIEFDVGQALVEQAQQDAKAAPEADGGPQKIDVSNARAAFDRAFGLANDPALKSEAQLASGNAAALGGDLEGAIASYRKALVADPKNERAKKNLLRVLAAKKQQPPPPPSEGGDNENNDDKNEEDEKKEQEGDKKDDKKDGDKKDEKEGENKKDAAQGDQDKEPKDEKDEKDEKDKKPEGGPEQSEDDKKDEGKGAPQPQPQPKVQKKEDAKKLLDALRSREKPLSPLEMRGTAKNRPKAGKDW